jgi:chromosomal replication initiator protein
VATTSDTIKLIPLEQPASVRRLQTAADERGWILPSFCVGPENRSLEFLFAEQQILQLSKFSPILLFGNSGVGKTCLAATLAVLWSRLINARPLHFTTGEGFCRDYEAALEIDDIEHFRNRHRRCKLLVIDDLEFVFTKGAAQEELLATLDALGNEQRPVVLTLARLPALDSGVLPALASRLVAGYSIEVHAPSPLTADEILRLLVKRVDPELPLAELLKFCRLQAAPLNARDLDAFVALCSQHRKIAGIVDSSVLASIAEQVSSGTVPTVASIAKAVARRLGIKLSELRGATRQSKVVRARALAILLSRRMTALSLQHIGAYFGGRDHSTVLHSCRKIDKLLESDSELAAAKNDVEIELHSRKTSLA